MSEILRKMTIKNLGFDTATIKESLGEAKSVDLCKIAGITTGVIPGQTALGEYLKMTGTFRGVNLVTAEVFEAAQCILPNFITESMAAALQSADEVEFGILIGVRAKAGSVTGYEFTVKPLIEPKSNDKMAALLLAVGFDTAPAPALVAPAKKAK